MADIIGDYACGSVPGGDVADLIARLESGERSNALDVMVEVALFVADQKTFDAVPNMAGTKVIYANRDGSFETCWAPDWSLRPDRAVAALKAIQHGDEGEAEVNPKQKTVGEP